MIVPHPVSRLFRSASDRASLTFHDLKHDDAPASPSPSLLPSLFPRKEDAHCSPPARPCYLFTNSERARAREENGRRSPVCDTVFVLRFMVKPARIYANVMPRPEGQVKKMARHRGRNHVETHYASVLGRGVRPRGSTRPSPLPLAAEISRNLIERRRERQWRFTDKLSSLPNEG